MPVTLKLTSAKLDSPALVIGGDVESSFIITGSPVISVVSTPGSIVGVAFQVALIDVSGSFVSFTHTGQSVVPKWTGKADPNTVSFVSVAAEIINRPPVIISAHESTVSVRSDVAGIFVNRRIFPPSELFAGYAFDGMSITIPIADIPGLSAVEANAVSGSWIDIFQAICIADHDWNTAFILENTPTTKASWNNRNMNAKSSKFQYGVGELNTFLKHFTISYDITKLVDEN